MIVVIGSGLAGLTAALRLLEDGHRVTLVAKGPGGLQLSQGTLDILGYAPELVSDPIEALEQLPEEHPYRHFTPQQVASSVEWLAQRLELRGAPDRNWLLPTAIGALRPTAYAPASMVTADVAEARSFAVVGIRQLKDFQADLLAGNLARTQHDGTALRASVSWVDLEARPGEVDSSPVHYAQALDDPHTLERFAQAVKKAAGEGDVVLVPGVVGLHNNQAWEQFTTILGRPAAEVTTPPPGIPGLRLYNALLGQARSLGVRHIQGAMATGFTVQGDRVTHVTVASAGRPRDVACDAVIHAPGGFESGSLAVDSYGNIHERVGNLPLTATSVAGLLNDDVFDPHPLFSAGVRVDEQMRVVGGPANLFAAGGIIAGAQRWVEKSGDGIAIASAVTAAKLGEDK